MSLRAAGDDTDAARVNTSDPGMERGVPGVKVDGVGVCAHNPGCDGDAGV